MIAIWKPLTPQGGRCKRRYKYPTVVCLDNPTSERKLQLDRKGNLKRYRTHKYNMLF